MVLNGMEASDGQMAKASITGRCRIGSRPRQYVIDSKQLHYDFLGGRGWVRAQNVPPVELGHGHAKPTGTQLGRKQIGALQEIGPVEGTAETGPKQLSATHRH